MIVCDRRTKLELKLSCDFKIYVIRALILKSRRFVPFEADLTQFGNKIWHPWIWMLNQEWQVWLWIAYEISYKWGQNLHLFRSNISIHVFWLDEPICTEIIWSQEVLDLSDWGPIGQTFGAKSDIFMMEGTRSIIHFFTFLCISL